MKNFKQEARKKHIRWNGKNVFPDYYPQTSGPYVSQKRINQIKQLTIALLKKEKNRIYKAFFDFGRKRYKDSPPRVTIDLDSACRRVHSASVCPEGIYGECDEERIWIAKEKMSNAYLLGTLLHEALHYSVRFNDRYICEDDEHSIFRTLGDDC